MRFFHALFGDSLWSPFVRSGVVALAVIAASSTPAAFAQSEPDTTVEASADGQDTPQPISAMPDDPETDPDADTLLDALALSEDGQEADRLARQIQGLWNESGSDSVDLMMRRASIAVQTRNFSLALDLLDTVIVLAPDYAEGWNRRATVHYLQDDYALSIADVAEVLRLEPRHFGALIGIGVMLDEMGQDRQAQQFLQEALRVHPFLNGAQERLSSIERRLAGAPI